MKCIPQKTVDYYFIYLYKKYYKTRFVSMQTGFDHFTAEQLGNLTSDNMRRASRTALPNKSMQY